MVEDGRGRQRGGGGSSRERSGGAGTGSRSQPRAHGASTRGMSPTREERHTHAGGGGGGSGRGGDTARKAALTLDGLDRLEQGGGPAGSGSQERKGGAAHPSGRADCSGSSGRRQHAQPRVMRYEH